jgi:hypothetical protein
MTAESTRRDRDMTAQMTTQPAGSGIRVAPAIVAMIAVLAFAAGLALAHVITPGVASPAAVAGPAAAAVTAVDAAVPAAGAGALTVAPAYEAAHRALPNKLDSYSSLTGDTKVTLDSRELAAGRAR